MCMQRKADKCIPTEEEMIKANINSFGDDIGKITNRVTSMFDVQAQFDKDRPEYKVLDYRIKCGQHFQQNAIDKAKGIIPDYMYPGTARSDQEYTKTDFEVSSSTAFAKYKTCFFSILYLSI